VRGLPWNRVHFACFRCRVAFKQRGSYIWDPEAPPRPQDCPNCKHPMTRLGRHFKAPPRLATNQWLKVELLYLFGERFESSHLRLGTRCDTLRSAVSYLSESGHLAEAVRDRLELLRQERKVERRTKRGAR
jgi:hypothetical protein